MKYLKAILFVAIAWAVIRTAPETLTDMHDTPTVMGGLMVLALFAAILYLLGRSVWRDSNREADD